MTDHDIYVALVDTGTTLVRHNLSVIESIYYLQDQRTPAIECDGAHFACTFSELYASSTTDFDPYVTEFAYVATSLALGEGHVALAASGLPEVQPAIASRQSSYLFGGFANYVISWLWRGSLAAGSDNIQGAFYAGQVGGSIVPFCGGSAATCPCGNGTGSGSGCTNSIGGQGYLTSTGAAATISDSLTMHYGGMPNGISALLFQGTNLINGGFGNPFGDGIRCVGAPVYRFPIRQTDGTGVARFGYSADDPPISFLGSVPLTGGTYYYQVWYRDSAAYCSAQTTNFSNALQVQWTP